MSEWETFCDESYYHLWRVRRKNERGFYDGFHVQTREEAEALVTTLNSLERESNNWEQASAQYLGGMHYYRGLVERIGDTIGEAAYTQDDGGKVDSVLCAKVPELVEKLKRERDEAVGKERESKSLISLYIDEKNTLKKKCENLFAALEYIANCWLSARHMEDIATAFVKTTKL